MSRYENYEIKNNVFGTLSAPISSLATTIQLGDGQGQRFSVNMLATLENIENGKVMKREIVLITAINGDVLTVTRKYAPCPANDDANSQGQVSYAFSADDTISAYIDKEHFDKIEAGFSNTNDEIDDLHDNGTDELRTYKTTGLGVEIKPGKALVGTAYVEFEGGTLTLTNNATNYIEIDEDGNLQVNTTGWTQENGKVSKVTTSGGEITNIDDWRMAVVGGKIGQTNIHELTEKQVLSLNDEFIIADSENLYQNKKIKYEAIFKSAYTESDCSDGDLVISTGNITCRPNHYFLCAKEWNFNNLTICSGITVLFQGDGRPVLKVGGTFCNLGKIDTYGPTKDDLICFMGGYYAMGITRDYVFCCCGGNGSTADYRGGGPGENGCGINAGTGTTYAGGGGGSSGTCCCGGNASGGQGGNGASAVNSSAGQYRAAGGGGFGYSGGGSGGTGFRCRGGDGGNSLYGNAGNGGLTYFNTSATGGIGGCSLYGRGGDGGQQACNNDGGKGGDGRCGGNGGNGTGSGNNGGNGGNAYNRHYGLTIIANRFYNNCIDAHGGCGGNGGNGRYNGGKGGDGADGGNVSVLYKCLLQKGSINCSGGCGGCGGSGCYASTNGTNGIDGTFFIGRF